MLKSTQNLVSYLEHDDPICEGYLPGRPGCKKVPCFPDVDEEEDGENGDGMVEGDEAGEDIAAPPPFE